MFFFVRMNWYDIPCHSCCGISVLQTGKMNVKQKSREEIMLSKIDQDLIAMKKEWAEEERKEMQEAFEHFHKSKEWGMICMINEVNDFFDIVIRDEEDINCRCLYGKGWKKSYLTPGQLQSIQEELQRLEQEKKVLPAEQSKQTYKWGIICRDQVMGICKDGKITAHSPEEAERILRQGELHWNTGITVFY